VQSEIKKGKNAIKTHNKRLKLAIKTRPRNAQVHDITAAIRGSAVPRKVPPAPRQIPDYANGCRLLSAAITRRPPVGAVTRRVVERCYSSSISATAVVSEAAPDLASMRDP